MVVRIMQGDALSVLATLPSESVQTCVTSPPYFALRDYQVDGQIGLEASPSDFIAKLVAVFDEVRRVLRSDGTCWVNIGDSYSGSGKGTPGPGALIKHTERQGFVGAGAEARNGTATVHQTGQTFGIPAKNLLLIPERLAIAMQDAGWCVSSRIAWCKKSAMPESVRDRPTSAWEHVWMFSKSRTYYYDQSAVAQLSVSKHGSGNGYARPERLSVGGRGQAEPWQVQPTSQLRNFWLLGPEPSSLNHYAAFPTEIPRRCILAGTSQRGCCPACGAPWTRVVERGDLVPDSPEYTPRGSVSPDGRVQAGMGWRTGKPTPNHHYERLDKGWRPGCACVDAGEPVPCVVLDPFVGSGTSILVASRLGRSGIGIELSEAYADMARNRIYSDCPMFSDVEVAG